MHRRVAGIPNCADGHSSAAGFAIAVLAPLTVAAVACALGLISSRMVHTGPVDRATFGWLVVVPVWALTPIVAAYAWRLLSDRASILAAALDGMVISIAASLLIWLPTLNSGCQFGAARSPGELIAPSLMVGIVIGGGLAVTCLATRAILKRGKWWHAVLVGAASGIGLVFLAITIAVVVLSGPGCQRPPV